MFESQRQSRRLITSDYKLSTPATQWSTGSQTQLVVKPMQHSACRFGDMLTKLKLKLKEKEKER
jgi:hypothetical protein